MKAIEWLKAGGFSWLIPIGFIAFGIAVMFAMPKYIEDPPYFSRDYLYSHYENMAEQNRARERQKKIARVLGLLMIVLGAVTLLLYAAV